MSHFHLANKFLRFDTCDKSINLRVFACIPTVYENHSIDEYIIRSQSSYKYTIDYNFMHIFIFLSPSPSLYPSFGLRNLSRASPTRNSMNAVKIKQFFTRCCHFIRDFSMLEQQQQQQNVYSKPVQLWKSLCWIHVYIPFLFVLVVFSFSLVLSCFWCAHCNSWKIACFEWISKKRNKLPLRIFFTTLVKTGVKSMERVETYKVHIMNIEQAYLIRSKK